MAGAGDVPTPGPVGAVPGAEAWQGDAGDRFYVLAAGSLRVERDGIPLRDVTQPGEGVGEIAILRDVPRTASVFAGEPSTLLAIDRAQFLAAVTGHQDASAAADAVVATRDR